jgi:PKD repeat protein
MRRGLTAALILLSACSSNTGGGTQNNGSPPVINSFAADSPTVIAGQSTTLRWSVTNATSISISPLIGAVSTNFISVLPTDTITYTLTASNSAGSNTATTTLTVIPPPGPPEIASFTANPASIGVGASSTLSWSVSGATSLSIDQGVGAVTGTSRVVAPAVTTTYTLTATGAGGTASATTTVTVHAAALHVQYDDPAPGGKLRLVRNAASTQTHLVLDLKVGSSALSGFGVALTLPMPASKLTFTPATGLILNAAVLDAGSTARTAAAKVPSAGPLQDMLVVGVARKKQVSTDGDVTLPAGATVFSIAVDMNGSPALGSIFNGGALASPARAALLGKAGTEVASLADFAIGNLSISP